MEQDTKLSLTDRFNKVTRELDNMKLNQSIGADSWIVYRQEMEFTFTPGIPYVVDFIPLVDGPFVANFYQRSSAPPPPGGEYSWGSYATPDPNVNGRWWLSQSALPQGTINNPWIFSVYSTRKGTIGVRIST